MDNVVAPAASQVRGGDLLTFAGPRGMGGHAAMPMQRGTTGSSMSQMIRVQLIHR
jgi:hypothetical protein